MPPCFPRCGRQGKRCPACSREVVTFVTSSGDLRYLPSGPAVCRNCAPLTRSPCNEPPNPTPAENLPLDHGHGGDRRPVNHRHPGDLDRPPKRDRHSPATCASRSSRSRAGSLCLSRVADALRRVRRLAGRTSTGSLGRGRPADQHAFRPQEPAQWPVRHRGRQRADRSRPVFAGDRHRRQGHAADRHRENRNHTRPAALLLGDLHRGGRGSEGHEGWTSTARCASPRGILLLQQLGLQCARGHLRTPYRDDHRPGAVRVDRQAHRDDRVQARTRDL